MLNSEAIETALVERLCPELKALGQASCSSVNYAVYVNSNFAEETLKPSLQLACPSLRPALGREDLSKDDAVIRHFSGHGNVMTGAWGSRWPCTSAREVSMCTASRTPGRPA